MANPKICATCGIFVVALVCLLFMVAIGAAAPTTDTDPHTSDNGLEHANNGYITSSNNDTAPPSLLMPRDTCDILDILNPVPGVVGIKCMCYGGASAPDSIMTDAINAYCSQDYTFPIYGTLGKTFVPDSGGHISMNQWWHADVLGNEDICGEGITVTVDQCKQSFHTIVDDCWPGYQKPGGRGHDACLLWSIFPDV